MIFKISMAVALSLISLVAGMYLLMKVWKEEMCCKAFAKIVGYVVVIVSIILFLCSSIHGLFYMTGAGCGYGERGTWPRKGMMRQMMMQGPKMKMMQPPQEEGQGE